MNRVMYDYRKTSKNAHKLLSNKWAIKIQLRNKYVNYTLHDNAKY